MDDLTEKTVRSTQVYDGVLLHVRRDEVELPNGSPAIRELIVHGGASCVLPIDDVGNTYLVRQYRYPFERPILEIPAGKLDAGEHPDEAARRELEEEIGMTADELIYLGEFYPTVAYSTEIIHMYVARGLKKTAQNLDEDEFLNIVAMPIEQLRTDVLAGKIGDGKTMAAVLMEKGLSEKH